MQALRRTFASIADDVGIVEGTVRLIFKDYVAELEQKITVNTPGGWVSVHLRPCE